MPGSGKGVVAEVALKMNWGVVVMGDEVRRDAKLRSLEPTLENFGKIMLEMRQKDGPAAVAKQCVPKILNLQKDNVIIDGIRSLSEVEEFKKHFPLFQLVIIHSSPKTRYERLFKRKRSDDPSSWKVFIERDKRELQVGLGNVIACTDLIIINERTKEVFEAEIRALLKDAVKGGRS